VRFSKCIAAVAVASSALVASGLARAETRPRALPTGPLATPWPAHVDCADFYGVDVSVDDRVDAVEWRGPEGRSIVVPVAPPSNPELAHERFRKASGALDYFGVWQTSRILFPYRPRPAVNIRAARGNQLLPRDFKPGLFETLVVRPRPGAAKLRPRADDSAAFGLRVVLHCLDKSKTGLVWACDEKSCGLRSFRDHPSATPADKWVDGPYRRRWKKGDRSEVRAKLVCARADGYEDAARRARRHDDNLVCERPAALADQHAALDEMSRDLLTELDLVLERGCAGTCSARVAELQTTIRALLSDPGPLRLRGARARFTPADWEVFEEPATMGWVARLGGASNGVELACAHFYVESSMAPPVPSCRLTVIGHGARLADYFPDARQEVELPDGGAVHLQGSNTEERDDNFGDRIVIFGSALAIAGEPVTLAGLRVLKVEIEYRPFGRLLVQVLAPDDEGKVPVSSCRLPAARARATFNGKPLARLTGTFVDADHRYNRDCILELAFPGRTVHEAVGLDVDRIQIPQGMKLAGSVPRDVRGRGPASLRIDEGDTHYALEIPDAFSRRALAFVSPADGVLHAGQRVTLRWQPETDDISDVEITLRRTGGDGPEAFVEIGQDTLAIRGDQIEFTIPAPLPDTFRGKIEVLALPALKPRVGPCPVDSCSVRVILDASDVMPLPARIE
jgi:hypothetical protein